MGATFALLALITSAQHQYDPYSDYLYRAYLWATVVGVAGGILGLAFLIKAANAAKESAEAAKVNADALIKSERALIQVTEIILPQKLSFITPRQQEQFLIEKRPHIVNNGRTHATVTRVIAKAETLDKDEYSKWGRPPVLPAAPIDTLIERNIILSPKQSINWLSVRITPQELEGIKRKEAFLYVYGRIDYRDISDRERRTGFCKLYWIPERDSGLVQAEDFVDGAIIPPKYTECT